MPWYAFRTHIKCEFKARSGLNDLGFETFVPVEKRSITRRRRKHIIESPLFTGYGFVKFDVNADNWGQIKFTDGIDDILRNNLLPVPVPDHDIERLQKAEKYGLFDRTKAPALFKQGDEVEIGEGAFAGLIGRVMKARTDERINVLLKFFGSTREVVFPLLHLKENRV